MGQRPKITGESHVRQREEHNGDGNPDHAIQ